MKWVGEKKVERALPRIRMLNPHVEVVGDAADVQQKDGEYGGQVGGKSFSTREIRQRRSLLNSIWCVSPIARYSCRCERKMQRRRSAQRLTIVAQMTIDEFCRRSSRPTKFVSGECLGLVSWCFSLVRLQFQLLANSLLGYFFSDVGEHKYLK